MRKAPSRILKTTNGASVVREYFDPNQHNGTVSDHLLIGTGKCLIEVCFAYLEETSEQEQLRAAIVVSTKVLKIRLHSFTSNVVTSKTKSMLMYTVFVTISTLHVVLISFGFVPDVKIHAILQVIRNLVSSTFCWTCLALDTLQTSNYFYCQEIEVHQQRMKSLSEKNLGMLSEMTAS